MVALGVVLVVVGVVGLAIDDGDDDEDGGATVATSTTTEPAGVGDQSDPTEDLVEAFYVEFAAAFGDGDVDFLFDRLDPVVIGLYGAAQCRDHVDDILGARSFEVVDIGTPAPWDFGAEREQQSLVVEDAIPVEVVQRLGETEATSEAHVTIRDGGVRWFTDCGDPV